MGQKLDSYLQGEQISGRVETERGERMDIEYNLQPVIQPVRQHNIREIEPPAASPIRNLQNGSQKSNPKPRSLVQNKKPEADRKRSMSMESPEEISLPGTSSNHLYSHFINKSLSIPKEIPRDYSRTPLDSEPELRRTNTDKIERVPRHEFSPGRTQRYNAAPDMNNMRYIPPPPIMKQRMPTRETEVSYDSGHSTFIKTEDNSFVMIDKAISMDQMEEKCSHIKVTSSLTSNEGVQSENNSLDSSLGAKKRPSQQGNSKSPESVEEMGSGSLSKKPHLDQESLTASLSMMNEENKSIASTADVPVNQPPTPLSMDSSEISMRTNGIVPMSETDSDGGKKHYFYQLGSDAGMKHNTQRKSPVPTEYSEYSEELATPLSEEVKERYLRSDHTQLENVTGDSDSSSDIQLPKKTNSDPRSLEEQNTPREVGSPKNSDSNQPTTQIPDGIPSLPLSLPPVGYEPNSMHITTNPDLLIPVSIVEEERRKDYLVNSITGEIASFYPSQVDYSYNTNIQEMPSILNSTSMQSTGSGPSMVPSNQDSITSSTEQSAQFPHLAQVDPLERLPSDLIHHRFPSPNLQPNDTPSNPSPKPEYKSCDSLSDFKSLNPPVSLSPNYQSFSPVSGGSEQKLSYLLSDFMSNNNQEVSMTRSLSLLGKNFKREDLKELYDQNITPRTSPQPDLGKITSCEDVDEVICSDPVIVSGKESISPIHAKLDEAVPQHEECVNVELEAPIAIAPRKIPRSVGAPVTFKEYCEKEWHGFTENAQRVRNGYRNLSTLGYSHLLSIRGDNYCAVRSTLFQTFCMGNISDCPLIAGIRDPLSAQLIVPPMFERYPFLEKWSFANKKEFHKHGEPLETLKLCIGTLAYEVNTIRSISQIDRMIYIYMKLNSQTEMFDFSLMEALKFYMFIQAAEYWESYSNGQPVPELMDILFLREDCMNLEDFVLNHLNNVGDGGGLEMIEMFLLGYTLGVQIRVIRISSFGKEDYLSFYPQGDYPQEKVITILAEDDTHYNAVANLDPTVLGEFYIPTNAARIDISVENTPRECAMATEKTYNAVDCKQQLLLIEIKTGEYGGYKQDLLADILTELQIDFYLCTKCNGLMRNACQIGEEQDLACEGCVGEGEKTLPIVRPRKKIFELRAKCPLATRGCVWKGIIGYIEIHLDECTELIVNCLNRCDVILKQSELLNHCKNECLNRKINCMHCMTEMQYKKRELHLTRCPELPLSCPNRCLEEFPRKEINSHIEYDCPNTMVQCRIGCGMQMKRYKLSHHERNECPHRKVNCKYCPDSMQHRELENHYNTCLEFPLFCPNKCLRKMIRKTLESHIENECLNTLIACPYKEMGCDVLSKRCGLEQHKKLFESKHLDMTESHYSTKVKKMEVEMENKDKDYERLIREMESLKLKIKEKETKPLTDEVISHGEQNIHKHSVSDLETELTQNPPLKTYKIPRSVGAPVTFKEYCEMEWHEFTENAQRVRNGYNNLYTLGYSHLLSIRGDNYSAMRSTLFQIFCMRNISDCPLLAGIRDPLSAQLIVPPMFERYPFLKKWSFANKKEFHKLVEPLETLKLCIGTLAYEVNLIRLLSKMDRMIYIYLKLNSQPEMFDFSLMEALKFYMFIQAAEYWESYSNGQPVPELMDILFLREDCMNLEDFVLNHLNNVGDGGVLEIIEMFLLGHTLGVQIRMIRISSFGKEDYLSFYPQGDYPQEKVITISAEGDTHYNAVANLDPTVLGEFTFPQTQAESNHPTEL